MGIVEAATLVAQHAGFLRRGRSPNHVRPTVVGAKGQLQRILPHLAFWLCEGVAGLDTQTTGTACPHFTRSVSFDDHDFQADRAWRPPDRASPPTSPHPPGSRQGLHSSAESLRGSLPSLAPLVHSRGGDPVNSPSQIWPLPGPGLRNWCSSDHRAAHQRWRRRDRVIWRPGAAPMRPCEPPFGSTPDTTDPSAPRQPRNPAAGPSRFGETTSGE